MNARHQFQVVPIVAFACALVSAGCSPASDSQIVDGGSDSQIVDGGADSQVVDGGSDGEVVDGGAVKNIDRDKVETYFNALAKVQSAEEEKELLTEFAEWLRKKGYKIEVEEEKEKHILLCPYFPPVTPWTGHTFFDVKNLELLPQ